MANMAARQIERQPQREVKQTITKTAVDNYEQRVFRKVRNVFVSVTLTVSALLSIWMLSLQADNYTLSSHIQTQENKITQQKQTNADLKANVDELSRYDRVYQEANKSGLKSSETNVKAVDIK
ncbi:cell division protein FtsL [Brochothrix campestris]|uniref:Cell division protein FtsL n=1 Tax=Brochothrix campestris FSL F6-1037 TaxID=1265861 RepID=W7D183_9LIST|nr:cell division protein FtsL [Brochothrix campestris]EUJ41741.1 cell division protein FtsL [Brochothrix campestris FSL F6-1037]